jgi:hypothetical protein
VQLNINKNEKQKYTTPSVQRSDRKIVEIEAKSIILTHTEIPKTGVRNITSIRYTSSKGKDWNAK